MQPLRCRQQCETSPFEERTSAVKTSAVRVRRSIVLLVAVAAAVAAGAAAPAQGGLTCGTPAKQVFLPWLDPTPYGLATNGGLESGSEGWSLGGGAKVASGNEPFFLNSAADRFSLSLPAGGTATSPWSCASVDGLVARLVAVASGSSLATLQLDLLYKDDRGKTKAIGLTAFAAALHGSWAPTLPIVIGPGTAGWDVLQDLTVDTVEIAFRFRASSGLLTSATWRIDDLYVDPWAEKLAG
jgi:hypothetical protein